MPNTDVILNGRMASWQKIIRLAFCALIFTCFIGFLHLLTKEYDKEPSCNAPYVPMAAYFIRPYDYEQQVAMLPNLSYLQWPINEFAERPAGKRNRSGHVLPLPPALKPAMSRGQRALFDQLLFMFTKLMFLHGYGDRIMLVGGTLLGTFRHHDMVPWDDDMDIMVDNTIRSKVQELLRTLEPDYQVYSQAHSDKFYTRLLKDTNDDADYLLSRRASQYAWGWPYLDISYYETNSTHLWNMNEAYGHRDIWPRSIVFPLRFRPLGPRWFPTPRDIDQAIRLSYDYATETCVQYGYSHVLERRKQRGQVACRHLGQPYAFVKRHERTCVWKQNTGRMIKQKVILERLIIQRPFSIIHILYIPIEELS